MSYSVSEVSKAAGVTVRTLHHYDEIGLLAPSTRSAAGYRQYNGRDLERLQEILFYRELGFGLEEIAGQEDILGPGKLLRRAIEADRLNSIILYGPPGCGKTSLAEVIASRLRNAHAHVVEMLQQGMRTTTEP